MLGQTYSVGNSLNNKLWNLENCLGLDFEEHIYKVLSANLTSYYAQGTKIFHTSNTKDNGKDIFIESPVEIENLFGMHFQKKEKEKLKIYVECKSSNSGKIAFNSFAGNLSRIREDNIGYYILVTNTTIVPYSYYQFKEEAERLGIEFVLIDQMLLYEFLKQNNSLIGQTNEINNCHDIYIEYQADSRIIGAQKAYDVYLWIRNYTDTIQTVSVQITTDRNWTVEIPSIEHLLEPKKSCCIKLLALKEHFDGIDDLILNVRNESFNTDIQLKGLDMSYNFVPVLIGKRNKNIIEYIKKNLTETKGKHIHIILGETGVGKSRIKEEVRNSFEGTNYNIHEIYVKSKESILPKLKREFSQFSIGDNACTPALDFVRHIDTTYLKHVIVIEDIHNASQEDLNFILDILQTPLPTGLSIILLGRNDYSAGNNSYFSFLQLCKETYKSFIVTVEPLPDDEAMQMIESIVRGIPKEAAYKIQKISNNFPLFIIQVIEYMLDLKLVYLLNRNIVGIENVESFSSHVYIPQSMEDLYNKRLECLNNQVKEGESLKFLYIASLFGMEFPDSVVNIFFEENETLLLLLLERRYIFQSSNGYRFVHESLFLYLQRQLMKSKREQKCVADWILNVPIVFEQMNSLKQGKIYLWAKKKHIARLSFKKAISEINAIKNYSSININADYYDYLEDIYRTSITYEEKKNIIACKIYIALHYHTPYKAIEACNWGYQKIKKMNQFGNDFSYRFHLKGQTAHSYINAGLLKRGEVLLTELLSETILDINKCDVKTIFDMYDKLSNIYIKYNLFDTAKNFCSLSLTQARNLEDSNLVALSYITTAKLYLYKEIDIANEYLLKADKILSVEKDYRIKCHNDISLMIVSLMQSDNKTTAQLKQLIGKAGKLLDVCIKNNFANSVVRIYMLLATLYYYCEQENNGRQFVYTMNYIDRGIDASIKFGISTYIWQFYNLKAIIFVKQNQILDKQKSMFDTIFKILKRQNLIYLGNCDMTYGNMLAITNILYFYRNNNSETAFNHMISQFSLSNSINACNFDCNQETCHYECKENLEVYKNIWNKLSNQKKEQTVAFGELKSKYSLQDESGYYIIVS